MYIHCFEHIPQGCAQKLINGSSVKHDQTDGRSTNNRAEDPMSTKRLRGRQLQRRNKRFLQENPLCVMCQARGRVSVAEEVDHIIPLYKGGADEWENLQGLCKACHAEKTARDMGYQMGGCDVEGNPLSDDHWWRK